MDNSKSEPLVRLDLSKPRYDQSTFYGRLRHFMQITDVRVMFTTQQELNAAVKTVHDYVAKGSPPVPASVAEQIWDAKKTQDAILHPQTGEQVPLLFRLSSFVPVNMMIAAGMLTPNPTIASVIFWQWVNQSYNVGVNHFNRNTSNELSNEKVIGTYVVATALSCSVAVGLGQFVKRSKQFTPAVAKNIQRFVPYTAVAIAGIANVFMMRWNEVQEGILVRDKDGKEVGKSSKAGVMACSQVAFSRCMSSLPCLTIPPILLGWLEKTSLLKKNPGLATPINFASIGILLMTALPVAVAVFPQEAKVAVSKLEPQFRNLKDSTGKPVEYVYFNRGL